MDKEVANSKLTKSLTNLETDHLSSPSMDSSSTNEETTQVEMVERQAKGISVPGLPPPTTSSSKSNGAQETMTEEKVMLIKAITDRLKEIDELKDVTQTLVASLVKTHTTIETPHIKALLLKAGPRMIVITTKAREDIAAVTKETDARTEDISEDMCHR